MGVWGLATSRHTILVPMFPLVNLGHTCQSPEPFGFLFGVLQALLHLDPFVRLDELVHDKRVTNRRVEGLVPPSLVVKYVFANDPPVLGFEGILS